MARVANAEYTGRKHNENFTLVRRVAQLWQ